GSPSGRPQRPPSSGTYVSTSVFGMLGAIVVLMEFFGMAEHLGGMPDRVVIVVLLKLLVVGCLVAGSCVLFAKKFAGTFVIAGGAGLFLLTLILFPVVTHMDLGRYVQLLGTLDPDLAGGMQLFSFAFVIVAVSCGFAPGTKRYLDFVTANRSRTAQPPQPMFPPRAPQQPYPQWGQSPPPYPQQPSVPQQPSAPQPDPQQQAYPPSGQQPQQWYPGPR